MADDMLLEPPVAPERAHVAAPRRFTADEFWKMVDAGIFGEEEHVELIGGEVIVMAPPGIDHGMGQGAVTMAVGGPLRQRFVITGPVTITFGPEDVFEPDMLVLKRDPKIRNRERPSADEVLLVVEVALTSLATDLKRKLPIYAAAGVPEYWVLDIEAQCVRAFRAPGPEGYAVALTLDAGETIAPLCAPDVAIAVAELV